MSMTKRAFLVLIFIWCSILNAAAEIVSVSNMAAAEKIILQHIDKNMFVAFDIDITLILRVHPAVYVLNRKKHQATLKKKFKNLTLAQQGQAMTLAKNASPHRLTEKNTAEIIQSLQKKGIKPIGFTASTVKQEADNDATKTESGRFNVLRSLGIDFSNTISPQQRITFKALTDANQNYPVYYKGILFANGVDKGKVIKTFLKHMKLTPRILVMVDDRKHNLTSIEAALAEYDLSIQFIGIEYLGYEQYGPATISEDNFIKFWQGIVDTIKPPSTQSNH